MSATNRTYAVIGAGVIGQVYAGLLAQAGHTVWLLARGDTGARLRETGVRLRTGAREEQPPVRIAGTPDELPPADAVLLAVRADQAESALPTLAGMRAPLIITLVNLADDARAFAARLGADRVVLGFPGVGGTRTVDGVEYRQVAQQPTTLGAAGGREDPVAADLRAAGLSVEVVPDMPGWLATHTVFIAGVGAALLCAGGAQQVGADRAATARMVRSVRDGFAALASAGIPPTPAPLRTIFTRVPLLFSVPYWRRQLRGELGALTLAPHLLATRDTEFPALAAAARRLTPGAALLSASLEKAGYPG